MEFAWRKEGHSHPLARHDFHCQNAACHSAFNRSHCRVLAALGHRHAPVEMSGGAQVHVFQPTPPPLLKAESVAKSHTFTAEFHRNIFAT